MKLRRLATTVAATSALTLSAAVPALADHEDDHPGPDATIDGNIVKCDDERLLAALEDLEAVDVHGDPGNDNEHWVDHQWWTPVPANPVGEQSFELQRHGGSGWHLAVLVKGSDDTNLFVAGPDPDEGFEDLFAPVNASGDHAAISHWGVCKFRVDEPSPTPTGTPTPTPTPTPTDGMGGGETPEPVPTEVPAGVTGTDSGAAGTLGLLAAATAFAAGGAFLIRRRFLNDG